MLAWSRTHTMLSADHSLALAATGGCGPLAGARGYVRTRTTRWRSRLRADEDHSLALAATGRWPEGNLAEDGFEDFAEIGRAVGFR